MDRLVNALKNDPAPLYGGKRLISGGISFPSKKNFKMKKNAHQNKINTLEKEIKELKILVLNLMEKIDNGDSHTE
jgi:hypothetical protein